MRIAICKQIEITLVRRGRGKISRDLTYESTICSRARSVRFVLITFWAVAIRDCGWRNAVTGLAPGHKVRCKIDLFTR